MPSTCGTVIDLNDTEPADMSASYGPPSLDVMNTESAIGNCSS